jgi:hypothetical protein
MVGFGGALNRCIAFALLVMYEVVKIVCSIHGGCVE